MKHIPVLLNEILKFADGIRSINIKEKLNYLDVTAGGGGHFYAMADQWGSKFIGQAWDRDPRAKERIQEQAVQKNLLKQVKFVERKFSTPPESAEKFDFILADFGVSSFQLEDQKGGMSLFGEGVADFRMNPSEGQPLFEWIQDISEKELADVIYQFGEEPKARKAAKAIKLLSQDSFASAKIFADQVASILAYKGSRIHPATRVFQALRIAINEELYEIKEFLEWAPESLNPGGRLAVISFHSLEDRLVKYKFRDLAKTDSFDILTKKPIEASEEECQENRRSRVAKLRVLERK